MINHFRSLLLNRHGTGTSVFGEEHVPADYKPVALPSSLIAIDGLLFGQQADRAARNYRLRQLLPLIHTAELREFVTQFDSRLTYDFEDAAALTIPDFPVVMTGDASLLHLYGTPPQITTIGGPMHYAWFVEIEDTAPFRVRIDNQQFTVEIEDTGWTEALTMPRASQLQLRIRETAAVDTLWALQHLARPQIDLGQLASQLRGLGESITTELFGLSPVEPYHTFQQAAQSDRVAVSLSGFALALAWRTEERLKNA